MTLTWWYRGVCHRPETDLFLSFVVLFYNPMPTRVLYYSDHSDFALNSYVRFKNGVPILVEVTFLISTTWWVSLLVDQRVSEGTCSHVLNVLKIHWNCKFVGLLHHPFWLFLILALLGIHFQLFQLFCGQGLLTKVQYPECAYGPYHLLIPI